MIVKNRNSRRIRPHNVVEVSGRRYGYIREVSGQALRIRRVSPTAGVAVIVSDYDLEELTEDHVKAIIKHRGF